MSMSPMEKPEGPELGCRVSVELPPEMPMLPPGDGRDEHDDPGGASDIDHAADGERCGAVREGEHVLRQAGSPRSRHIRTPTTPVSSRWGSWPACSDRSARWRSRQADPLRSLGGQSGTFGSMMQQAMQAAKGGGGSQGGTSQGASSQGRAPQGGSAPVAVAPVGGGQASAGPAGAGAAAPHARDEAAAPGKEPADERHHETPRERPPVEAAGPGDGGRPAAGPLPVAPPEHTRRDGEDDLARRM